MLKRLFWNETAGFGNTNNENYRGEFYKNIDAWL